MVSGSENMPLTRGRTPRAHRPWGSSKYAWMRPKTHPYEKTPHRITGGEKNVAEGVTGSISGGFENKAIGTEAASVSGGLLNEAGGTAQSSVSGGRENEATGVQSWVGGGSIQTKPKPNGPR